MHNTSDYFLLDNCKFANEKAKRNCARLGLNRDFSLFDSYTIEASCYAYLVKGSGRPAVPELNDPGEEPTYEQLKPQHFYQFGKELI